MQILYAFCKEQYKDFSPEEIKKAFDLFNANKLEKNDIKHFNAFSCNFLGKILGEYRKYRRTKLKHVKTDNMIENKPSIEERIKIRKMHCKALRQKIEAYHNSRLWKFDEIDSLNLLNEISRLKFIDWLKYMDGKHLKPEIEEQALQEIQNEINRLKMDLQNKMEVKKLMDALDLHLSGATVQQIENKKRSYCAMIVLKDWLNDKENCADFMEFYENEIG